MSTEIVGGQTRWEGSRDEEGHRTYKLHVQTVGSPLDGPASHLQTPGLPLPGSVWAYDNDLDVYAWCTGASTVTPREARGNIFYDHVYTFTTRPRGSRHGRKDDRGERKRCADIIIQDPLAEPTKTSGGFLRNTEEYRYDRDGLLIRTTSFEPITGPQAEFDRSRSQVVVEYNDPALNLETYDALKDAVNEAPLWGLPARCWKLCEWHWDRKLYGSCFFYYTHRLTFESNSDVAPDAGLTVVDRFGGNTRLIPGGTTYSRWDHYVPDESSLALRGFWDLTDPLNPVWTLKAAGLDKDKPTHYDVIPSPSGGGNIRRVLGRNRRGTPAVDEDDQLIWCIQAYREADFLARLPRLPATL